MNNKDIRQAIKNAGLRQWQVATTYKGGVHETTFIKFLRNELNTEQKEAVYAAIEQAKAKFKKGE